MTAKPKWFQTAAIDYPNSRPHIGTAFEKLGVSTAGDVNAMLIQGGGQRLTFSGIGAFCASLFAKIPIGAKAPLLPLLVAGIEQSKVSGELYAGRYWNLTTPAQLAELDKSLRH